MTMTCNCCGRRITAATISRDHVYTLGVYDLVTLAGGERAALRIATRRRAVCADCVSTIHAAATRRRSARRAVAASA